jgi:hypothetical protein
MISPDELTTGLCLNCGCMYSCDGEGHIWEPGEPADVHCLEGGLCRCHTSPHRGCFVTREWTCDDPSHVVLSVLR